MVLALALALAIVHALTPIAVRVAVRLQFFDVPAGYKGHRAPTPYLGGAAVMIGFLVASIAVASGAGEGRSLPVLVSVIGIAMVGTLDDRWPVAPWQRVAVEAILATGLWATGLGWSLGLGPAVDVVITVLWVVAVVNAFNLFDNMDGAASAMAGVVAGAVAVLGLVQSDAWLARERRSALRRLRRVPAAQPGSSVSADLPRRRR